MTEKLLTVAPFYKGWGAYQQLLMQAIAPLTDEQLTLSVAPHQRQVGMIITHLIACRAGWFHWWMGEGGPELFDITNWDEFEDEPLRPIAELVRGLEITWKVIEAALERWTPADLDQTFKNPYSNEKPGRSRQWILWHVLEHDLYHGGEISLILGTHNIPAIDL